jgi:hypothetical protein
MFALVAKNAEGTWDVWDIVNMPPSLSDRIQRIENAIASDLPIVGMDVTAYGETATSGAVFDGVDFSGGKEHQLKKVANPRWDTWTQYAYIWDNTIILVMFGTLGTPRNEQMSAIFDGETTIALIPEGTDVKVGDIWDGENFISI